MEVRLWVSAPSEQPLLAEAEQLEVAAMLGGQPMRGERPRYIVPKRLFRETGRFSFGLLIRSQHLLDAATTPLPLSVWAGLRSADGCLIGYGRTTVQLDRGGLLAGCMATEEGPCAPQSIRLAAVPKTCTEPALVGAQPAEIDREPGDDASGGGEGRPLRLDGVGLREDLAVCISGVRQRAVIDQPEQFLIPALALPTCVPPGDVPVTLPSIDRAPQPLPLVSMRPRPARTQAMTLPWRLEGGEQIHDQALLALDGGTKGLARLTASSQDGADQRLVLGRLRATDLMPLDRTTLGFETGTAPTARQPARLLAEESRADVGPALVVVTESGTTLFRRQETGAWQRSHHRTLQGRDAVLADFDGQGSADLLLLGAGLTLHRAETNGFSEVGYVVPIASPCAVTAADLDGDGQLDIAALARQGDDALELIVALLNRAAGDAAPRVRSLLRIATLPRPSGLPQPGCPLSARVVSADFDGDGRTDLTASGASHVYLNRISGAADPLSERSFQREVLVAEGALRRLAGTALAVADLNIDGLPDLLIAVSDEQYVALLNQGAWRAAQSRFRPSSPIPVPAPSTAREHPSQVAVFDLNSDGFLDVVRGLSVLLPLPAQTTQPQLPCLLDPIRLRCAQGVSAFLLDTGFGWLGGARPTRAQELPARQVSRHLIPPP